MVMTIGFCNAPAMFEQLMESVLRGLTYSTCLVHLDDMVIGHFLQEQLDNLRKVFQRLREAHLKMNPEKYQLFQKEVLYLDKFYLWREWLWTWRSWRQ
jgi:hypothetical protein